LRLLVVSHTAHYRDGASLLGLGPTVREIDHLATLFEEVRHLAPLHDGKPPESALPYRSGVRLVPVPPAGGGGLADKLAVARLAPRYAAAILREAAECDVIHVRCPANISLLAVLLLAVARHPERRWVKYAGNWAAGSREPWSSKLPRRLLTGSSHRAVVTVNGEWPDQPPHVRSFLNPCLTEEELREGCRVASVKLLAPPARLLFVGRLDEAKGAGRVLEVLFRLAARGLRARARFVGDGPRRGDLERRAAELPSGTTAQFLGPLPRTELASLYADSDLLLLPSSSEGWPKALSEGMAYGVVPVASDVGCIPQYLRRFGAGRSLPAEDLDGFAEAVAGYCLSPAAWKAESQKCVEAARAFSYDNYLEAVKTLLGLEDKGT